MSVRVFHPTCSLSIFESAHRDMDIYPLSHRDSNLCLLLLSLQSNSEIPLIFFIDGTIIWNSAENLLPAFSTGEFGDVPRPIGQCHSREVPFSITYHFLCLGLPFEKNGAF
jgi:hypothetical protein